MSLPQLMVANAQFVTDRIATGGDLAPEFALARRQLQDLVDAGITHIADLRDEWNDIELVKFWAPQVEYYYHPVEDAGQTIPGHWFEELSDWVARSLENPDAKVLIHCHMGVNRGPSATFGVLLAQGLSVLDALTAIREARPVAVIDYADDALDWWLDKTDASPHVRSGARGSLTRWRKANDIDKYEVIRQIRETETIGSSWCITLGSDSIATIDALVDESPQPTLGLVIDAEPEELAIRDEVVLWADGEDGGVVGFGLVMAPPRPRSEGDDLLLPVVVMGFNADTLLPVEILQLVAPGTTLGGPNPTLLTDAQVVSINLGLRMLARAAAMQE